MIRVDGYPVDCATEERLTYKATATKFPVEKGAAKTEHVIVELPVLEIDGVVSDTPIGAMAVDPSRVALNGQTLPSRDAFEFFTALHLAGGTVTVECGYGKFDDMVMTSLAPSRERTSAKAFKFSVTFEQIDIRETRRVTVAAVPNATGRKNLGNQPVTKVNNATVEGVIYAITFPVAKREFATKGYGKPVATDLSVVKNSHGVDVPVSPFDCYRVLAGRERNAEGYLTPRADGGGNAGKYEFHQFAALYDPATNTRRDFEGRDVTTTPTPKEAKPTTAKGKRRGWWNEPEAK